MDRFDDLLPQALVATQESENTIERVLGIVRTHLGMEVAYLSEFVDGRSVFRAVDAPGFEAVAYVGASMSLQDVYCQHILEGRLPELIPDTADEAVAMSLPITQALPIGSHVSIPIRRPDGSPFGMFCCLSRKPNRSLNDRDLAITRVFSELAAREINGAITERLRREAIEARMVTALSGDGFRIALQPIFDLNSAIPSGFEALCRFTPEPYRTPDVWFGEAAQVGRQVELETAVIAKAIEALGHLPADTYISVNASPETVVHGNLYELFLPHGFERIVLELTEHAAVKDYAELDRVLGPLRFMGVKLAIDDAGAGYSGLQHIVRLRPDMLKLDMSLTRNIDTDWSRRSLAAALVHFAAQTRAVIVAEGIETQAELEVLQSLGIHCGQGYLLGRPMDLWAAQAWFEPEGEARSA